MTGRKILIVGATGQQGRATIASLFASEPSDPPMQILALTRSASSPKTQSLQSTYPDVILVEGDTRNPSSIFQQHSDITSIFLVTVPSDEVDQARPLIEAAVAPGRQVDHLVFSSVDRGGNHASWETPTNVPHFAAKHKIEQLLRQSCDTADRRIRWTILRPTGFMDNFTPSFFGQFMATLWDIGMPKDCKMQLVSTHDIGVFAAKALSDPELWAGRAVGLAGDELTLDELRQIFKGTVGTDLPTTYTLLAQPALWWIEEVRTSFDWFSKFGYGVDIKELRQEEPRLQTFQVWLRDSSPWKNRNSANI